MLVIVTGMHRSGTSTMAGILHQNGITMGSEGSFHSGPSNPKGFYENKSFRSLNDKILAHNGYAAIEFDPEIPGIDTTPFFQDMRQLLFNYGYGKRVFGFKDPRTCLTISGWLFVASSMGIETRIVVMERDHRDIAYSLHRIHNADIFRSLKLSSRYYTRLYNGIGDTKFLSVNFYDLLDNPVETMDRVSLYLDYSVTDTGFLDSTLVTREPHPDEGRSERG